MYHFRIKTFNRNYNTYFYEPFGGAMTFEQAVARCEGRANQELQFIEIDENLWRSMDEQFEIEYKPY